MQHWSTKHANADEAFRNAIRKPKFESGPKDRRSKPVPRSDCRIVASDNAGGPETIIGMDFGFL
jgi:hypothetical protein